MSAWFNSRAGLTDRLAEYSTAQTPRARPGGGGPAGGGGGEGGVTRREQ
ncbi:MAG: hypothetical protein AMXMBFR47_31240, partial [Planctomycetota bacterium]